MRTALAGGYELSSVHAVSFAAGVVGLVLTALAFYGGFAFLLEDSAHRTVLPLARRGRARRSLHGDYPQQLDRLEAEAGVRQTL